MPTPAHGTPRLAVALPVAVLAVVAVACGGDDGMGSPDGSAADAGESLPAVAAAALPELTPCPTGWQPQVGLLGETTCEPWPGGEPSACGAAESHLPGADGCAPVGAPCPSGEYAEDLPSDAPILYVRASGAAGDGTRAMPFGSVVDGLTAAAPGAVVALARGRYAEALSIGAGVALRGACAAETILAPSTASAAAPVVAVASAGAELWDIQISDANRVGVTVPSGGSLAVRGVVISGVIDVGLLVPGGAVTGTGLLVRGTRPLPDGRYGRAIDVEDGGSVELEGVVLFQNHDLSVFAARPGTVARLSDFAILDTLPQASTGEQGIGLRVRDGATVQLSRGTIERAREVGILADGEGTSVSATDVVIRDQQGRESDGAFGGAASFELGARVDLRRVLLERNEESELHISASSGRLEDVVARDTAPQGSDGRFGRGVSVLGGGTTELIRTLVARNRSIGVSMWEPGTTVRVQDLTVHSTQSTVTLDAGWGLLVSEGASIEGARVHVADSRDVAVYATGPGTSMTLEDLLVEGTDSRELDGQYGRGVDVEDGGRAALTRVIIRDNRNVGVYGGGLATALVLSDAAVLDTDFQACADGACADHALAIGIGASSNASVAVVGFSVVHAALCGVHVSEGGQLDLREGEVVQSAIGACVFDPLYDIDRLTTSVRFLDNEVNLDVSGRLPLPDPASPFDG